MFEAICRVVLSNLNCLQVETNSGEMGSAVAEIKKLSEQLSQMRQENIALKVGTII